MAPSCDCRRTHTGSGRQPPADGAASALAQTCRPRQEFSALSIPPAVLTTEGQPAVERLGFWPAGLVSAVGLELAVVFARVGLVVAAVVGFLGYAVEACFGFLGLVVAAGFDFELVFQEFATFVELVEV